MGFECYPNHKAIQDLLQFNYIGRKPIYDFLSEKAANIEGRVLDFGCGKLVYKPMFQKAGEYIGLDIEDSIYKVNDPCVVHYDGRTIPFGDGSFDCVYSIQVLDDIEDLDYSVSEIARVLKRGGIFMFSVPMAYPIHTAPHDFRRFTHFGLEKYLSKYGFDCIEVRGSNSRKDTARFLNTNTHKFFMRKLYVLYINCAYLFGLTRFSRAMHHLANALRKLLGKPAVTTECDVIPLEWLVFCRKKV